MRTATQIWCKSTKKSVRRQYARANFYAEFPKQAKNLRRLPFFYPLTGRNTRLPGKDFGKDAA
jgi:hypothetical protein